ncbi:hypothetical protein [Gillisia sp. Hel_I_29]|uniref:hypothetical protein n=1 Tax=Gillisia sp. Hel_I_29 TaxID=1249975 RepID=UPI000ADF1633|nr:hypothetical protein [Gillisia sp. Hel_I_29]
MKIRKSMNANKYVSLIFILYSFVSFSQKKEDVYFVLENGSSEYTINNIMLCEKIRYINLLNKKEYEYHQKKIKEAKKNGTYYFDPESGRDNLKIKVSKLTFEIISKEEIKIKEDEIKKLNLVDYNWIQTTSWKKVAKQPVEFKDIYFLKKSNKNTYILYKVEVTIVAY